MKIEMTALANKNKYQKDVGTRELKGIVVNAPSQKVQTNHPVNFPAIPGYSKQAGTFIPQLFIIISGGVKREKDYFMPLSAQRFFPRIKICFIAEDQETGEDGLSPLKMFKAAGQIKTKYDEGKGDDIIDTIYLVADMDDFISELLQIKPLCEQNNMTLIISNSCFEIWLYYGKHVQKPLDFVVPQQVSGISSAFKTYLGEKVSGGVDPRKAFYDIENAIVNSKANYEEDNDRMPGLFSTGMFLLAEHLLCFIKDDLGKFEKIQSARKKKDFGSA